LIGAFGLVILLSIVVFWWIIRKRSGEMRARIEALEAEIAAHEKIEQELIDLSTAKEHMVGELFAQLEATNKELEAFAYSVSHDVRSPLRSMLAYSEILLNEHAGNLDEEGRLFQERIRANAERLDGYISGILAYSSLSRQEILREDVNLTDLAWQVIGELSGQIGGREIKFAVEEMPPVSADRALMRVVLTNLISNAVKFTDTQPAPEISIGSINENGREIYYIRDNGIGLDMKFAETIFETFQRLHGVDQYVGRGIGLALVRRIILRHGGNVWVQSEEGEGATFYFTSSENRES
jgi:light-regulated signal transduction histidine kinase (bacteriophytochrome)